MLSVEVCEKSNKGKQFTGNASKVSVEGKGITGKHIVNRASTFNIDIKQAGVLWCGVVWCGVVWCGVVWCGVVWCGVVWCGVVWCVTVCCGGVCCGVV